MPATTRATDDPLWYKDGLIYQLHVKTFADSNGDGVGDLIGLIGKLDYLQNLGVTAIWLLPFYPSPLRDDGYDIADYTSVNPAYGTLKDFRLLLKEAHARGLKVITELVINHTSDQHPWFQKSRAAKPGSKWRNMYVWSDTTDLYSDARIIFKDFETSNWTWDPVAQAYYWHRFYNHQPDLNFDNPDVLKMVMRVMDFWLGMGVDGLRLDAIPYLIERDGTNCENLDETHHVLRQLRAHMEEKWENRMLLAEANQWPEDAVAYFGDGDECQMSFHFPLMPRMFMALHMEDRYPIVDILEQTPDIPEGCQWATFLRNHDELTLEMVTDEERDYMYRVYAKDSQARINLGIRRRLAPLLDNNRRKIELINVLMLSLPGTPIIYYGDEIGMGDNIYLGDRNGCRTPMQWNADRNAGFSRCNPQQLFLPINIDPEYNYEAVNVELQENNVSSLLWWMRRVLAMRKRFKAFGRGRIEFLQADNTRVLAFTREYEGETILAVLNLSRFTQIAEIELFDYAGFVPEEVFSHNKFPLIRENEPYTVTLGPYDHFWLLLTKEDDQTLVLSEDTTRLSNRPDGAYWRSNKREEFGGKILREYLTGCRWFSGKGRRMTRTKILDNIPLELDGATEGPAHILLVEVNYSDGPNDLFALPVMLADSEATSTVLANYPQSMIVRYEAGEESGVLYDATFDPRFQAALLRIIAGAKRIKGRQGLVVGRPSRRLSEALANATLPEHSHAARAEQSNTSILYESTYFLKLYRRLQEGVNPDAELTRYLSEEARFERVPRYAGGLEYRTAGGEIVSLGLVQEFTTNEGDAWTVTLSALGRYYDRVLAQRSTLPDLSTTREGGLEELPEEIREMLEGLYLQNVSLLGTRTAEMHLALARTTRNPEIAPEPFSQHYQRSLYQSVRESLRRTVRQVQRKLKYLPQESVPTAEQFLASEPRIMKMYESILKKKILSVKTRIHGDYHLGQVLWTGRDYIIIDFEGEPSRTLGERRLRRSPLRDVAGMLRSFHYAAYFQLLQSRLVRPEDSAFLIGYADLWSDYATRLFLQAYIETARGGTFIPKNTADLNHLLKIFVLDKAVYEVGYELNNRPAWLTIPIRGIAQLVDTAKGFIES